MLQAAVDAHTGGSQVDEDVQEDLEIADDEGEGDDLRTCSEELNGGEIGKQMPGIDVEPTPAIFTSHGALASLQLRCRML